MSQYSAGTVAVTNNSSAVVGTGTAWLANVVVGSVFTIPGSKVPYVVGAIADDTHLTLSGPYAGATASGLSYVVNTSFTPNLSIPYVEQGDVDTATILKRAMLQIDQIVATPGVTINATSATSFTPSNGSKVFAIQTGKQFAYPQYVIIASAANAANFMGGQVTSYDAVTGALVMNITTFGGSGAHTDWDISLSGVQGPTGTAGAVWKNGAGVPSNALGTDGDYYLNNTTDDVYLRSAGTYSVVANIRGATGAAGAVWRHGTGVPSNALGIDGDYYLNNTTADVYFRSAGTYSVIANILGATGSPGATNTAPDTHASTSKTTPVDADEFPLVDSEGIWALVKLTWGNLKTTLKAYFDTLYVAGTNNQGYLNIPPNSQSANYTTVLADVGKHLLHPAADTTARTFTIDSNANVAYPIGTALTFVNQNGAGVLTIAITADTMRLAGAGTTGSRTLTANGMATALKITTTEWIISGTGLI